MNKFFMLVILVLCAGNAFSYTATEKWQAACFVAKNEGLRLQVYTCVAGKATIGWGSTNKTLTSKGTITKEEADRELYRVLDLIFKKIDRDNRYAKLTFNQKVVLADMCYHYGSNAVFSARDLNAAISTGDAAKVKEQLLRWNKARINGKLTVVKGLVNRCLRRCDLW